MEDLKYKGKKCLTSCFALGLLVQRCLGQLLVNGFFQRFLVQNTCCKKMSLKVYGKFACKVSRAP